MSKLFSQVFQAKDIEKVSDTALRSIISHLIDEACGLSLPNSTLEFIQELITLQHEQDMEPVFCISISFLNTSLMLNSPTYRIDAYGQDWMLYTRPIATKYVPCEWFQPIWNNMVSSFQKVLDGQVIQKYCSPLQAEQAAWKCVGPLVSMMGSLLKYCLADMKENKEYKKLVKGSEFRIEFGEFWDWKLVLLGEYPEVDIFNTMGKMFPHRSFSNKLFENKIFSGLNLKGCVFQDCEFINCKFLDCVLADCKFENSRFIDTYLAMCLLAGAQFNNCTLEHMTIQKVTGSFDGIPLKNRNDWYMPMVMTHTSLQHVDFISCFLSDCVLEQCTTVYVSVKDSETERSDFTMLCGVLEENGHGI